MSSVWAGRVVRLLTVAAFGVCVVLAIRLVNRPDAVQEPKTPSEGTAIRVAHAIARQEKEVTVTGYVFEGGGWDQMRLCNSRERGSPPVCMGPFFYLEGVDRGSFEMKSKDTKNGVVRWSPDAVTVLGTVHGSELAVSTVLGSED